MCGADEQIYVSRFVLYRRMVFMPMSWAVSFIFASNFWSHLFGRLIKFIYATHNRNFREKIGGTSTTFPIQNARRNRWWQCYRWSFHLLETVFLFLYANGTLAISFDAFFPFFLLFRSLLVANIAVDMRRSVHDVMWRTQVSIIIYEMNTFPDDSNERKCVRNNHNVDRKKPKLICRHHVCECQPHIFILISISVFIFIIWFVFICTQSLLQHAVAVWYPFCAAPHFAV